MFPLLRKSMDTFSTLPRFRVAKYRVAVWVEFIMPIYVCWYNMVKVQCPSDTVHWFILPQWETLVRGKHWSQLPGVPKRQPAPLPRRSSCDSNSSIPPHRWWDCFAKWPWSDIIRFYAIAVINTCSTMFWPQPRDNWASPQQRTSDWSSVFHVFKKFQWHLQHWARAPGSATANCQVVGRFAGRKLVPAIANFLIAGSPTGCGESCRCDTVSGKDTHRGRSPGLHSQFRQPAHHFGRKTCQRVDTSPVIMRGWILHEFNNGCRRRIKGSCFIGLKTFQQAICNLLCCSHLL